MIRITSTYVSCFNLNRDNHFFQAWISQGIRIHGNLLICEGSAFCSTCIDDPAEYHGARYKYHLSPSFPHFEVRIHNDFNFTKYFNDLNVVFFR